MDIVDFFQQGFFQRTFFGMSVAAWLLMLIIGAGYALLLVAVRAFLHVRIRKFSKRTQTQLDDVIAEILDHTRVAFLIVLGLYLAVVTIDLPFGEVPDGLREAVGTIVLLALLLQVVAWGNHLIGVWMEQYRARKIEEDAAAVTTMHAIAFLGKLLLYSIVFLVALDNLGFDVTALIAGLGISGIAVALAVQNILGDLFASLSIVLDKPFVVGDFLIIDEYLGTVEHVGLKTTRLRSLSGEQLVFSNSDLLKSRIRNYKRMFERRVVFTIGVTYQTPHDRLEAISTMLREIIDSQDHVRFDRAHFKSFGDFSLVFEVVYYVLDPDYNTYMDIQQAINLAINRRFEENGIEFAYPTQTLYVDRVPAAMS